MKRIILLLLTACMAAGSAFAQEPEKREEFYENNGETNREQNRRRVSEAREQAERTLRQVEDQIDRAREQVEDVVIEDRFHNPDRSIRGAEQRQTYSLSVGDNKRRSRTIRWKDGHYAGVGLYYNGLVSSLGNLKLPSDGKFLSLGTKSIGITLNPIDFALPLGGRTVFVTGLGFELNNFRFDGNLTLKRENGITVPDNQYNDAGIRLEKSKLFTAYINIPILFEVQLGRHNDFFINAGIIGGMRIGAHTKIKADDPQLNGKFKDHGNMGLRNFHYGYMFQVGYRWIALSATYYASPLFRSGQGPDVKQTNIGLSFMF